MSEMMERVALVLDPDAWNNPLEGKDVITAVAVWDDGRPAEVTYGKLELEPRRKDARDKARAAIAAMREPTDAMMKAAGGGARVALGAFVSPRIANPIAGHSVERLPTHEEVDQARFLGAWRAMVDEALK